MTRFRELRLQQGLSQEAFRQLYNEKYGRAYTAAAISQIEHGKRMPELGALMDFADFYGVSIDYLLGKLDDTMAEQLEALLRKLPDVQQEQAIDGKLSENVQVLRWLLQQSVAVARQVEEKP